MKRFYFLFVLLLLTTTLTNAQTPRPDDSTKYIWYQNQYGLRQPRISSDSFFLPPYGDTTGRRPYRNGALMMHTDGKYYKWNIGSGWNLASGTSGEANTTSTVGTGVGLTKPKVGVNLPFKSLTSDTNLVWDVNTDDLKIKIAPNTLNYINYLNKPVPFNISSLFIGDSETYGYNELGGTLKAWAAYLKDYLNLTSITNLAISGIGARRGYKQLSENLKPLSVGPLGTMIGFNNVRGTTDTAHVFELVRASHRAMAALLFLNPATINFYVMGTTGSANPNISTSQVCGSCTASSEANLQDFGSRTYYYRHNDDANTASNWWLKSSLVANETVTVSNVEGPGIVVGTWAATSGWSRIEVRVDGILKTTYDPNNRIGTYWADGFTTNGITNDAIVVLGLRDTLHTVQLKFLDGGATGGFDYVAGMKSQITCLSTPLYVLDLPHMNSTGYSYPGGEVTEAQLDSCSTSRFRDLQYYFPGYPIFRVNENAPGYYDPTDPTQIQSDGIHFSALGQWSVARAVIDAMGPKWLAGSGAANGLDQTLATGNTSARRLLLTGNNTSNTNMEVADLVFQSYANSNSWVGSNIYFDGSNFRYKHNGPASMLYFNTGYTEYKIAASGTGGNIATLITVSTIAPDGSIFQGGSITSSLTGAGAKFFIDGTTGNIKSPNVLAFGPTSYSLGLPNMIWATGTQPGYTFYNSSGGTNQKVWDLTAGSTTFSLRMGNDPYNLTTDVLTATRTDYTHADVDFGSGAVRIKDSLKIDNTPTGNASDSLLVMRNQVVYTIPQNTVAAKNYFNADLSATGNRSHNFKGFNLTVDSLKDYKLFSKGSFFGTPVRSSYQVLPNTPSSGLLITYAFSKTDLSGDSVSVYLSGNPNTIDLGASDISNGHNSVVRVSNSGTGKSNIMLQTDSLSASMQPRSTYDSLVVVGSYNSGTKTNPVGKASLSDVRGYKIYVANLSQSGTSDPTAVVLGGNQIGSIVWTRTGLGSYTGVLSGAFISGKTFILSGQNADGITANCFRSDVNTVTLKTYLTFNGGSTDVFSDLSIEIRVYP